MTSESSFHGHLASYIWTEHRSDRNLWPKKVDKGEGEKEWTRGRKKWVQYRTPRTDPPNDPLPPAGPYPKHLLFPNNAIEGLIHWLSQSPQEPIVFGHAMRETPKGVLYCFLGVLQSHQVDCQEETPQQGNTKLGKAHSSALVRVL